MAAIPDLLSGLVDALANDDAVAALVGDTGGVPWILQDTPQGLIEGTGTGAVAVAVNSSWKSGGDFSDLWYPMLLVVVWVDPVRDTAGVSTEAFPTTKARAYELWEAVDAVVCPCATGDVRYGGVSIGSINRMTEPTMRDVADGTGLVEGESHYSIVM